MKVSKTISIDVNALAKAESDAKKMHMDINRFIEYLVHKWVSDADQQNAKKQCWKCGASYNTEFDSCPECGAKFDV